ncbi:cysteine rich repeat-containing protein [Rhizobium jaguaris]|uniref:Cysteine rich repeat protein n=1 Tax=Rhizobium jaguaris TaxID=1312183 RepID=A0A387G1J0_9HYPH|nr:cysteine rich repeat-containing protein [Rhizobium jaguaris]AYG61882.1 hypothetical protein CCGE525_23740 [Rhizobium jaguaris]
MSRRSNLFAAVALACIVHGGLVQAQTMSYADAITKLAGDCGSDIHKFCSGLNLGGGRIADCLQQNAAKVSPTCKASVASVVQSISLREQAQAAYSDVCRFDIAQRCRGIKGDGNILACLVKNKLTTDKCSQAITDAGWR